MTGSVPWPLGKAEVCDVRKRSLAEEGSRDEGEGKGERRFVKDCDAGATFYSERVRGVRAGSTNNGIGW